MADKRRSQEANAYSCPNFGILPKFPVTETPGKLFPSTGGLWLENPTSDRHSGMCCQSGALWGKPHLLQQVMATALCSLELRSHRYLTCSGCQTEPAQPHKVIQKLQGLGELG